MNVARAAEPGAAIDAALREAVERGELPGVAAIYGDRRGDRYQGACGARVLGASDPMTLDTVVWLASMTKAITSACALIEVERGRLDLDAPAERWSPGIGEARVLEGFDADGAPRLRAPRRPITLRHLLGHTAGYGYDVWNGPIRDYLRVAGLPTNATGKLAALRAPLLFDPGERWQYGINIDWAGRLVEAASGRELGEHMREHLFEPLDMHDTAFRITPAMRERLAKIHQRGADGVLAPTDIEIPQQPEFQGGGGGLYGTVRDYQAFLRMILNDGVGPSGRVLSPRVLAWMRENAIGDLTVQPMRSVLPQRSNDAEFFPGVTKRWSLAFQINEGEAPTGRSAGGLMWAGLANCYCFIDPARGLAGTFVSQVLPFADPAILSRFLRFESLALGTAAGIG